MFKNYIKIAYRSLVRRKLYSFINIGGLAVSLAVTVLLCLFVLHELSFDNMYKQKQHIYRVLAKTKEHGTWCTLPDAVSPAISNRIPSIKYAVRMFKHGYGTTAFIKADNNDFKENNFYWADANFFKLFNRPFIQGNPASALTRPNTVVLSSTIAKRYFGNENPVGKTITLDNHKKLEVTGVYKDFPANSTLDCNIIGSFKSTKFYSHPRWGNASFETYCLLNDHANIRSVEKNIQLVVTSALPQGEQQWFTLTLQPFARVHLYSSNYLNALSSRIGNIKEIRNLALLALLILIIACINYMNLATARFQKRTKEVAMNKTMGASKWHLILRFYVETAVLSFVALIIGLAMAVSAVPLFNNISGSNLVFHDILLLNFFIGLGLIWLVVTLLAGSYPAIYLSKFSPKSLMQKTRQKEGSSAYIRKGLVIVQFLSSIVLVAGVMIIYQQLHFIHNKNLGYKPENVVAISVSGVDHFDKVDAFMNELKNRSDVLAVSTAQGFPGMDVSGRTLRKSMTDKKGLPIKTNRAIHGMAKVLGLHFLAGHGLPTGENKADKRVEVVLNKKAVDYLGYTPQQAIGKKVITQLGRNAYIVGVVNNFNFASLHQPVGAYAFHDASAEPLNYVLVRFKNGHLSQTIAGFKKSYRETIPNTVFDYTFLDKYLNTLYATDQRMARIILVFSILAIIVASLGLFGLTSFMAEQRTKEIGIRKVLGATVTGIVTLLSKDFLKLVGIGFLIAVPIAWFTMHRWLQNFAYHIHIGVGVFLLAGVLAMIIALATVSWQSIRAALMNPVESLRNE